MAKQVRANLEEQLHVGDSREKIEAVLQSIGIRYSYDEFSNRYQSTVREECGKFEAVSVYVNLDDQGRLSAIEVFNSYTWL